MYSGDFDKEKFKENIRAAIDRYIELVDGTPAMKTKIRLFPGTEDSHYHRRRNKLLTFLKGTIAQKASLISTWFKGCVGAWGVDRFCYLKISVRRTKRFLRNLL